MSTTTVEIAGLFNQDDKAKWVSQLWDRYNTQRAPWLDEQHELRNYLFATDTSTTSVSETTGWKNKTTTPKLTQIRDNLHVNYEDALFPTQNWLQWEADTGEENMKVKRVAIESYMLNKTRNKNSNFRSTINQLLLDWIDTGNAFCTVEHVKEMRINALGDEVVKYMGPRLVRIPPVDIVFNPRAETFDQSPKVIRALKSIGEIKGQLEDNPEDEHLQEVVRKMDEVRKSVAHLTKEDWDKVEAFHIDGFGSLSEYLMSDMVEILTFIGDYHNADTGEYERNQVVTVVDRQHVLRDEKLPGWMGKHPVFHVGWRDRDYNLWGMSPLANLVGMQYRIDHLENSKADAHDLANHPPLFIQGDVDEFDWFPGEVVFGDIESRVTELGKNLNTVITAENQIQVLEQRMELYAGAPKEAMGFRTPGEKTAFEVSKLDNASNRVFNNKTKKFEQNIIEPALEFMLEVSVRNLSPQDSMQVLRNEQKRKALVNITRRDLVSSGSFRAIGASHFATQAQLIQNLTSLTNSNLFEMIRPHTSGKELSKVVEEALNLEDRNIFGENVAIFEQQETQRLMNQAEEDLQAENAVEEDLDE